MMKLVHIPYGKEHPYNQEPFERFPRNPEEGERTEIGICVYSLTPPERVWVAWKRNDELEGSIDCSLYQKDNEKACYRAELPPFRRGDRIVYRIHAISREGETESEEFSFVVSGWIERGALESFSLDDGYLHLECLSDEGVDHVLIGFMEDGSLVLRTAFDRGGCNTADTADTAGTGFIGNFKGRYSLTDIVEHEDRVVFRSSYFSITVSRSPCLISIQDAEGAVILKEARPARKLVDGGRRAIGRVKALSQAFISPEKERFFGFGERYNGLNQGGKKVDILVFDQWRNQGDKTYIPVPFFLSSLGYGLHLDIAHHVEFDLAASDHGLWSYIARIGADGVMDTFIFTGRPVDILKAFTGITGKPALPPDWVFGPWMSGNEWNSQERVMREVARTLEYDIPATVLVIEAWSDEKNFYIWNDARYEPKPSDSPFKLDDFTFPEDGKWPDPKGLIDYLHELGIRVILWQIPVIKHLKEKDHQHDLDEAYMIEKGFCVKESDGSSPYRVRSYWFKGGLVPDFTNPEATSWWLDKRAYLMEDMGIDGFKTDGGEHLWGDTLHFSDGRSGDELLNLFPNLYEEAYSRFVRDKRKSDGAIFSRAGFTGAGRYPVHWAGDQESTWEEFRAVLSGILSAGLSGIPFIGLDIGGFSGELPTAELYIRSSQMAAFCPVMQYHSDFNEHRERMIARTPWNIAEYTKTPEVLSIYRKLAKLRMKLMPYIKMEAKHCAATGAPLMAPLFFYWPEDKNAWEIEDQYCFGRALLIAPVVHQGETERSVYLPDGKWLDFLTGERITGGEWITASAPLEKISVYRREEAPWIIIEEQE